MVRKRQTRKSLSFTAEVGARIEVYCEAQGIAKSAFLEDVITKELDTLGVPVEKVLQESVPKAQIKEDLKKYFL
jgi:hypothetical protein